MFFLSDLSSFARPLGRKDTKPRSRIKRLLKATWNPNTANAIATGGTIGLIGSAIKGGSVKANKIGALGGATLGAGLGIASQYKKQRKQY